MNTTKPKPKKYIPVKINGKPQQLEAITNLPMTKGIRRETCEPAFVHASMRGVPVIIVKDLDERA